MSVGNYVAALCAGGAAILGTGLAEARETCPTVWNTLDRFVDAESGAILREDRRIGLRSQAAVTSSQETLTENAQAAGLDVSVAVRAHLEGLDCNDDGVIDGTEHIFLDGAPAGFTPEDWAVARASRSDSFMHALQSHLRNRSE